MSCIYQQLLHIKFFLKSNLKSEVTKKKIPDYRLVPDYFIAMFILQELKNATDFYIFVDKLISKRYTYEIDSTYVNSLSLCFLVAVKTPYCGKPLNINTFLFRV